MAGLSEFAPIGTEQQVLQQMYVAMTTQDKRIEELQQHDNVLLRESQILEAMMCEQMGVQEYAESRKRIEKELFPPAPSLDQAAVDRMKEDMVSMQKDASDFRNETQGMLKDLSNITSEMAGFIREMRDREPAAPASDPEEDFDRGTITVVEPDDWMCPGCGVLIPSSTAVTHKCPSPEVVPPYICPNCNEEVPNELKNEHKCKRARAPKKKTPKKK